MKHVLDAQIYQMPVGQGGFHRASIITYGAEDLFRLPHWNHGSEINSFELVYDCGGTPGLLRRWIQSTYGMNWRRRKPNAIDVLVLSHLHADHINGFREFVATTNVPIKRLIIPHYDDEALLTLLARVASDTNSIEAVTDVAEVVESRGRWFMERGVEEVVFVRPGDGDEILPPEVPLPIEGPSRWEVIHDDKFEGVRGADHEYSLRIYGTRRLETTAGGQKSIASGSIIQPTAHGAVNHLLPWYVIPYCRRPRDEDVERRRAYVAAIDAILDRTTHKSKSIVIAPSQADKVLKRLRQAFEEYVDGRQRSFNELSVSIYSGTLTRNLVEGRLNRGIFGDPVNFQSDPDHIAVDAVGGELLKALHPYVHFARAASGYGWILTGDSDLRDPNDPWYRIFSPLSEVSTFFQLPHHGSRGNIRNLSAVSKAQYFFATADDDDPKHPHPDVVGMVQNSGKGVHIVGEEHHSLINSRVFLGF